MQANPVVCAGSYDGGVIWDSSRADDGTITHSFSIITLPASPLMGKRAVIAT